MVLTAPLEHNTFTTQAPHIFSVGNFIAPLQSLQHHHRTSSMSSQRPAHMEVESVVDHEDVAISNFFSRRVRSFDVKAVQRQWSLNVEHIIYFVVLVYRWQSHVNGPFRPRASFNRLPRLVNCGRDRWLIYHCMQPRKCEGMYEMLCLSILINTAVIIL